MRNLMCVSVASALLALTACSDKKGGTGSTAGTGDKPKVEGASDKPKDLIVGQWAVVIDTKDVPKELVGKIPEMIIEFQKDGTLVMSAGEGKEQKGKYAFVEEKVFETEGGPDGKKEKVTITSITKDEMVTKDEKGKEQKFKKKK